MPARNDYGKIARHLPGRIAAMQTVTADAALLGMQASMAEAKHGVQWPELPNRSSAPGESPAIQDLDAGLAADLHRVPLGDGDQAIITDKDYAAELEWGRIDGKVAPRPYMAPTVQAVLPGHLKRLGKVTQEAAHG